NLDLRENLNSANRGTNRGKSWEKPWENDLNFFPLSGFPGTLVRNLNFILVERGTGLEPATSTLGNIRQPSHVVHWCPLHLGLAASCPGQYAVVHAFPW